LASQVVCRRADAWVGYAQKVSCCFAVGLAASGLPSLPRVSCCRSALPAGTRGPFRAIWDSIGADLCDIARCVFGNPFRPITADPAWLTSTVKQIAEAIYQDRAFDRLPVLADALEEAGCDRAEILDHCRSGVEHVLGCWIVDLLLGKE
jgi:hypothetical protein